MSALWPELNFDQDPRLIVGNRKSSGLIDCYRVGLHKNTFTEFREIAEDTISRLNNMNGRPYEYFGALDKDEYFFLDKANIPKRPGTEKMASVLVMVAETDNHPVLSSDELRSTKMSLYVISYPTDSGYIEFIRRTNPKRSISPGCRFFQYGDTLKKIESPDFIFDNRVDLIVGYDKTMILSDKVVQILFRDVRLVMESIEENVNKVATIFQETLPLTVEANRALREFCNKGPRNAKRLYDLVAQSRLSELNLDPTNIISALSRHDLEHLVSNGKLNLTDEVVPSFFDYIEGRLYHDDHTQDPRRADRFSKRA